MIWEMGHIYMQMIQTMVDLFTNVRVYGLFDLRKWSV